MKKVLSVFLTFLMLVTATIVPVIAAPESQAAAELPEGFDILVTDSETSSGWIGYHTDENGLTGRPAPTLTAMPNRGNVITYTCDGIMYAGGGWSGPTVTAKRRPTEFNWLTSLLRPSISRP